MNKLTQRKATLIDLPAIIALLIDDELGGNREINHEQPDKRYLDAFNLISTDPNQYLMVITNPIDIVGTCHLTLMPSLTFIGSTRLQIEAVRIAKNHRGQKIGEWMMNQAIAFAKSNNASIIQLTTNKERPSAKKFYEQLGFKATHEGMKYYLQDPQ